ncbi:uncharacterized protein LOC5563953 [Aedes aegypti]|uniref:Uncharacterized protein n=1 Tax=Aedes aegypti TaxID=7159 RepID=A0A6I8T932_AEDAE|nr:uncharacterized protein LOC5563953 [Aedes aegypti]
MRILSIYRINSFWDWRICVSEIKLSIGTTVPKMKALLLLVLIIVHEGFSVSINSADDFGEHNQNATDNTQLLLRKKRFLLFPVGAAFLVTVAFAKALVFKSPGGNFAILELDMYHPLPDYNNRITQFKIGEISWPPKPGKPALPPTPPPPPTLPPKPALAPAPSPVKNHHDHHYGHELSEMELQDYLKSHPDTWVPPGYSKDRSDRFESGTYNPYPQNYPQSQATKYIPFERTMWDLETNQPPAESLDNKYNNNMWDYSSSSSYRMKRSDDSVTDYNIKEEEDRYNISHHRNWEHFYHYREKRDLYHTLEHALGAENRFQMKSCIMRAICEARSLLFAPGKSMIMDLLRIMFSVPLKDDLQDEYSKAMRDENMDCHEVYGKQCSISILYLLLFGKFVP